MARTDSRVFAFLSAPIDTPIHSHRSNLTHALHSIGYNEIGDKGASALAAILKETKIINLRCATARVFAFVSMPIDTPAFSPYPLCSSLTV